MSGKAAQLNDPRHRTPEYSDTPELSPANAPGKTRPPAITILLVDDDADCRTLVHDAINQSKVSNQVFEVSNGAEALDFLRQQGKWARAPRPGLIYLDIEMPGMSGQDVLKTIKADPNLRDIPVVMM